MRAIDTTSQAECLGTSLCFQLPAIIQMPMLSMYVFSWPFIVLRPEEAALLK